MKNIQFFSVLFIAFASSFGVFAQGTTLTATCTDGRLTIKGANTFFSEMGVPPATQMVAYLYFQEGDTRNGLHTSQTIQSSSLAKTAVFSDVSYCAGNAVESPSFAMSVKMGTTWKNFIFIDGVYQPGRNSLSRCGNAFSCTNGVLKFEFYDPNFCAKLRLGSDGTIPVFFGPGNPLNNLPLGNFSCQTDANGKGILTTLPDALDCYGGCSLLNGSATITVGSDVCRYENWQLTGSPVCAAVSDYSNGNLICNSIFDNCLPEINTFIAQNQSSLPCRQWKQLQADCDPNKWAYRTGSVGIGTNAVKSYKLMVKDGVITNHVQVQNCAVSGWCDYVFAPEYRLMPLSLVKEYIHAHGHLPDTPSAEVIEKEGSIDAESIVLNHQLKTEEIFLHLIALQKEVDELQKEYRELKAENVRLKNKK